MKDLTPDGGPDGVTPDGAPLMRATIRLNYLALDQTVRLHCYDRNLCP